MGRPRERDPEDVRADVLRGFVSPKAAEAVYGVVLGGAPGFEIDEDATRKQKRKKIIFGFSRLQGALQDMREEKTSGRTWSRPSYRVESDPAGIIERPENQNETIFHIP